MTESELILAAVWRWFEPRRWAVCDNVSWGFHLDYEADAVAVSKSGKVHELEAKSVKSDLVRDAKKHKWARMPQCDYFWYVVPAELCIVAVEVGRPLGAGVIAVSAPENGNVFGDCRRLAVPKPRRGVPVTGRPRDSRNAIWRLASLRYWDEKVKAKQKKGS